MMKHSVPSLALAAAVAGLLGGATARLNAQPASLHDAATSNTSPAGILLTSHNMQDTTKHSCKGKNDCKGQGGGKDPGKNSCKGKGDCATDGSTPPASPKG